VAMGTSGNQFKNAPIAGALMRAIIEAVESGRDHDAQPTIFSAPRTGHDIGLGAFSRRRQVGPGGPASVLG
jgi:sarcosine oxidase subunit beta